jgi:hypothetical protein
MRPLLVAPAIIASTACAAPARDYGYARSYVATHEETEQLRECRTDLAPPAVCEDFARWHGARFSWFGVITRLDPARDGAENGWVVLRLSHRAHVEPHRCANASDDTSCRVTVDVHDDGAFSARLQLRQDDWTGPLRVRVGSLVRVVGTLALNGCSSEDGPFFDASWYRHWPHGFYTTTSSGDHAAGE